MKNINKWPIDKLTLSQMFFQPILGLMEKQLALAGFISPPRENNILKENASDYSKRSPPLHAEGGEEHSTDFVPNDSPAWNPLGAIYQNPWVLRIVPGTCNPSGKSQSYFLLPAGSFSHFSALFKKQVENLRVFSAEVIRVNPHEWLNSFPVSRSLAEELNPLEGTWARPISGEKHHQAV